jgi:hypothetical protein
VLASIWNLPVVYEDAARAMVSGAQYHGAGGSFRYIEDMASMDMPNTFSPRFVLFAYAFILAARCDPALGHNSNTEWTVRNLALSDGMLLKMMIVWPHQ